MTGTHVVPDRQQYDGHTPITSCKKQSISYQTALSTSIRRPPAHPASALTIHPRYKLYDHLTTTQAAMIRCNR